MLLLAPRYRRPSYNPSNPENYNHVLSSSLPGRCLVTYLRSGLLHPPHVHSHEHPKR